MHVDTSIVKGRRLMFGGYSPWVVLNGHVQSPRVHVLHHVPDPLSQIPYSQNPEAEINGAFPDDTSSRNLLLYPSPRGLTKIISATNLTPAGVDEEADFDLTNRHYRGIGGGHRRSECSHGSLKSK